MPFNTHHRQARPPMLQTIAEIQFGNPMIPFFASRSWGNHIATIRHPRAPDARKAIDAKRSFVCLMSLACLWGCRRVPSESRGMTDISSQCTLSTRARRLSIAPLILRIPPDPFKRHPVLPEFLPQLDLQIRILPDAVALSEFPRRPFLKPAPAHRLRHILRSRNHSHPQSRSFQCPPRRAIVAW